MNWNHVILDSTGHLRECVSTCCMDSTALDLMWVMCDWRDTLTTLSLTTTNFIDTTSFIVKFLLMQSIDMYTRFIYEKIKYGIYMEISNFIIVELWLTKTILKNKQSILLSKLKDITYGPWTIIVRIWPLTIFWLVRAAGMVPSSEFQKHHFLHCLVDSLPHVHDVPSCCLHALQTFWLHCGEFFQFHFSSVEINRGKLTFADLRLSDTQSAATN